MSSLRYDYLRDLDAETRTELQKESAINSRLALCTLQVPPSAISPDGSEWLHCVEAIKKNNKAYIRVITNTNRGVNIMVPCHTTEQYYKLMDLRFQVRNQDKVLVTFPELFIAHSGRRNELYLRTHDFKVFGYEKKNKQDVDIPFPTILI